jgi:hypothetical protein
MFYDVDEEEEEIKMVYVAFRKDNVLGVFSTYTAAWNYDPLCTIKKVRYIK